MPHQADRIPRAAPTGALAEAESDICVRPLPVASHLCEDCKTMGVEIRMLCEVKDFTVSRSWASLQKGMQVCAFCKMIASPWWPGDNIEGDVTISNRTGHYEFIPPPTNGIDMLHVNKKHAHEMELAAFTHEGSLPATAQHVSGRCIKAASDLSRASIWLDECLHSHNHGSSTGLSRPSRLVAVGTADGTEPIKIVDDSDTGHEYLTLSYCWGRTGNLCTTAETYETFCTYIPWAKLPKTFQDAIQIARNLGVGHIWIDSLCIVQGDLHDWETESAKMADIYSGSLMTIMAAAASDSHGGCFQDRFAIQNTVALPYTDESEITEFSVYVGHPLPGHEETVQYSPLFQRGWVFQERLMSKRKLIFGDDQTYWECNTIVLSESDIRRRDKFAKYNRVRNDAFRIFSDPSYRLNCPRSRARLWMDLVADYSRCLLTYYTDRLPSLSGLARSFAQQSGESYVAGLWREQMPHSLCWRVYYRMSEESCEQDYCAPSWSWASVPGQVTFLPDSHNCELEIVSTNIQLASQDLYGALRTGSSICVRGRLRAATLVKMEKGRPLFSEIEEGPVSCRFMDRGDRNLPLELFYLEISHTCCLLLEETAIEKQFRRLGLSVLSEVSQEQDYLFHGLEKQTLTLV